MAKQNMPTPREFLRQRHPEQFSDSETSFEYELGADQLSYHLETLTAMRREASFETFARRLCEREVCPNILPQTGPVGGGDSHTDGSTFPVASSIAAEWPWYFSRESASQLWAFAFSTKKQWRAKIREDIEKIAALSLRPDKAFFVTSQFVRDKARAELIEELRRKHGLDVTILDRQWIILRTIEHDHVDLVVDALGVSISPRSQQLLGPMDQQRRTELERLEAELRRPGAEAHPTKRLVESYLHAARLCRGMALPKARALGYHQQAIEASARLDDRSLIIAAIYEKAWTLHWWYEDMEGVDTTYDELEKHTLESDDPWHCELLCNLLFGQIGLPQGKDRWKPSDLEGRRERLSRALRRIEDSADRPNASVYARVIHLLLDLMFGVHSEGGVGSAVVTEKLRAIKDVLPVCQEQLFAPLAPVLDVIIEMGSVLGSIPEYGDLFELACELQSTREGEQRAGGTLFTRGVQCLVANEPGGAIIYLARAREKLNKNESLAGFARAVAATGLAYQALGLRWAARIELVRALYLETRRPVFRERPSGFAVDTARRLWWLDLGLGRVPSALAWRLVAIACSSLLGGNTDMTPKDAVLDDGVLSVSLLHANADDVPYLGAIVPRLRQQHLFISTAAVLFLLGHLDRARDELPDRPTDEGLEDFFRLAADQPAKEQMRIPPLLCIRGVRHSVEWTIDVRPLACRFVVDTEPAAVATAEHVAGVLELMLHAGNAIGVVAMRSQFSIRIRCSPMADNPPTVHTNDNGRREFDIDFAVSPSAYANASIESQEQEQEWLMEIAVRAFTACCYVQDGDISKLGNQGVIAQVRAYPPVARCTFALMPSSSSVLDLVSSEVECPPYRRSEHWRPEPTHLAANRDRKKISRPEYSANVRAVLDLVRPELWTAARWFAMAFAFEGAGPPLLVFMFEQPDAGRVVVEYMKKWIEDHTTARARFSIICDDSDNCYVVQVCAEPLETNASGASTIIASRKGFKAEPGRPMLLKFRELCESNGSCRVAAGSIRSGRGMIDEGAIIAGARVHFRMKADIEKQGESDIDAMAISAFDEC